MRPLYRAGQRDTCTVRSQPVYMKDHNVTEHLSLACGSCGIHVARALTY